MEAEDRDACVKRYQNLFRTHGPTPAALDWGSCPRQNVRFFVLWDLIRHCPNASVLDVGCGFADLCTYLRERNWTGNYVGVDCVPEMVETAKTRCPNEVIRLADVADDSIAETADFVYASGIFNHALPTGQDVPHMVGVLDKMFRLCRIATVCDYLSTFVDYTKPHACHWDVGDVCKEARKLTKRIVMRMDYLPYEFAVILWKDDKVNEKRLFAAIEEETTTKP